MQNFNSLVFFNIQQVLMHHHIQALHPPAAAPLLNIFLPRETYINQSGYSRSMFHKRGTALEYQGFFARHRLAIAATTLIGTIIGAGILGIPYVVAKVGFLYGLLLIIVLGIAFMLLNLFLGEIVLRTKEQHQLPGYAGKYLGIWGKRFMTFSMIVSLYGALIAYLIGEGATLHSIFHWGDPLWYTLIFFAVVSFIIYAGVRATGKVELFLISLLFLIVILIGIFSFRQIQPEHLLTFNPLYLFLPYGVILFAYVGLPSIPELQEVLGKERQKMKKAIIIGSVIPIILYILFVLVIVGIIGVEQFELLQPNERIATIALSIYSQPLLGLFANLLAVLSMFTSFLTIGIALVEIYEYDYRLPRQLSLALALGIPLFIALFNLTTFITVLGITGAVAGGLDGILLVLMYWKSKILGDRRPEYSLKPYRLVGILLIIMFALGLLYQLRETFF